MCSSVLAIFKTGRHARERGLKTIAETLVLYEIHIKATIFMEFIPKIKDTRVYKSKVCDSSLDAICGLFIIYMIMTHAFQWSNVTEDEFYVNSQYIFFMFMAWFFYKSGMFHKQARFREVAVHNWKRLIVPCIVYSAVGEVVYSFSQNVLSRRNEYIHEYSWDTVAERIVEVIENQQL